MTAEEFGDNMRIVVHLATQQQAQAGNSPLFMYDNAAIHAPGHPSHVGVTPSSVVLIPTYSPDFNKVIEHIFHRLKVLLRQKIYEHQGFINSELVQQWVQELFFGEVTAQQIKADADSLKQTFLEISKDRGIYVRPDGTEYKGTGGDYATGPHR